MGEKSSHIFKDKSNEYKFLEKVLIFDPILTSVFLYTQGVYV